MKAYVLKGPGELVPAQIERPVCGPDEVIVRPVVVNICKTDVKCVDHGQRDLVYPRVLGHEIAGIIDEVGSAVAGYAPGQRVHVHPGIACGRCWYCQQGLDNLCDSVRIMGFNYDGGFQEYLKIPAEGVAGGILNVVENDALPLEAVSFIEPLACCVNLQNQLNFSGEPTVLIIGGGRLGVLNLLTAKAKGAGTVILVEPDARRRESGLALGFDAACAPEEAAQTVARATGGRGADIAVPCCPDASALTQALGLLRKQGQLGYFSGLIGKTPDLAALNSIHYKEIHVAGSYGCGLSHSIAARKWLESGAIDVLPLISHRIPLADLPQGMDNVRRGDGYSTVVRITDAD
jgi:L-iditol 2-dehydrogenase